MGLSFLIDFACSPPLEDMCTYLNMVRNIVNWRGYMAHQLTLYSVTLGLAWILLPMDFIACWILRILVWTFLGPGMKLVDIFLFHPIYKTRQELEADPKHGGWHLDSLLESEALERMGEAARLAGEEALKVWTSLFGHVCVCVRECFAHSCACLCNTAKGHAFLCVWGTESAHSQRRFEPISLRPVASLGRSAIRGQ